MNIVIIKLGALGDVMRTTPIAEAIKKKYPESKITWVTKENALELLEGNPYIDKALFFPLQKEIELDRFDLLYNFDIDKEAALLASEIKADKKYGFYLEGDYPVAFNPGAEYYLNTLFDDNLKKNNRKTYQEMMFDTAELSYNKEQPLIYLAEKDIEYASSFVRINNIDTEKLIGLHMGAGPRWPSKAWSKERIKEFIRKSKEKGYNILLFGGPDEKDKIFHLVNELKRDNLIIYHNNPNNSIKEFASLVNLCQKMVCSDSFSLHISLALNKPTVGLFFCTTPYEVEDYGLLKKIISPLYDVFFPEMQNKYSEELVNSITVDKALEALESKARCATTA